jgi:hypothetical protein
MNKLLTLVCIACLAFAACKSSTSTTSNPPPMSDTTFLLKNATWDSGGTHGWNGWTFRHTFDTIDFEMDAPPGGGTWGFKIHSVDLPTQSNNITQSFTNLTSGVYEFTLWSHTKYVFPDSVFNPAWVSFTKVSGGVATKLTDSLTDNLNWFPQTMFDTLTLLPTDTITIEISSGLAITHGDPTTVDDFTFAKLP